MLLFPGYELLLGAEEKDRSIKKLQKGVPFGVQLLIGVASAKWPNEPIPKTKIPQLYDGKSNTLHALLFWRLAARNKSRTIKNIASVTHYMH